MEISRALISVTDKAGLNELGLFLIERGIEIIATKGTREHLTKLGIESIDIAEYTGYPEMMNGRLKTLHPKILGGILVREGEDNDIMNKYSILPINLVVINLYNFKGAISSIRCTIDRAIEQIDIGGPALLRAAAKNHEHVVVLSDIGDYDGFILAYEGTGKIPYHMRLQYAQQVFDRINRYNKIIADYLLKVNPQYIA